MLDIHISPEKGYLPTIYIQRNSRDVFRITLHWRHNERDDVSNHHPRDCLLNCSFRRISKKTSKLCVTGFCEGNSPMAGEFPAHKAMFPFTDVIMKFSNHQKKTLSISVLLSVLHKLLAKLLWLVARWFYPYNTIFQVPVKPLSTFIRSAIRRLTAKSREVLKPRDWML